MAGGVALNCVGNGRILREGPFKRPLDPAGGGRRGGALGVAQLVWHRHCGKPRAVTPGQGRDEGRLSRPGVHADAEIETYLQARSVRPIAKLERGELLQTRRRVISRRRRWSAGSTGAWSSARARWAQGASWVIPRSPRMQAQMNIKIKFREGFRPFAPSVLRERVSRLLRARRGLAVHAARRAGAEGAPDPDDRRAADASGESTSSTWRAPTFRPSPTSITRPGSRP